MHEACDTISSEDPQDRSHHHDVLLSALRHLEMVAVRPTSVSLIQMLSMSVAEKFVGKPSGSVKGLQIIKVSKSAFRSAHDHVALGMQRDRLAPCKHFNPKFFRSHHSLELASAINMAFAFRKVHGAPALLVHMHGDMLAARQAHLHTRIPAVQCSQALT